MSHPPRFHPFWLAALLLLISPAASAVDYQVVANAADLESCLESPGNRVCHQTQDITFRGNTTRRFLDIATRANEITWFCDPGVGITWNNDAGAPAPNGVDIVRITPRSSSYLLVSGCRFHTQVGGSTLVGDPTSVQVIYVRYDDQDVSRSPLVEFVNLDVRTRMTGSSTIGVGANQAGAARVNVRSSFVHAAIAVDVKAWALGQPVPFQIVDSVLEAEPSFSNPRCWKQLNDAALVDVRGSVCRYGQLQFAEPYQGGAPQEHDLDGLTLQDSPVENVKGREMIIVGGGHSIRGAISVVGTSSASYATLLNAYTAGVVDLEVHYDACHGSYTGAGGGRLLESRNTTRLDEVRMRVTGPVGCPVSVQPISPKAQDAITRMGTTGFLKRDDDAWAFVDGEILGTGLCQNP